MWPFKKKSFIQSVDEWAGTEQKKCLSDISYSKTLTFYLIGKEVPEKPYCPEWYTNKWEICLSGNSNWKYAIKRDGLYVKDSSAWNSDVALTLHNIDSARHVMYYLIEQDIKKQDFANRKDETVETWP